MNRRQLFGSLGGVLAAMALPVGDLFAQPAVEEVDHAAIIKGFVADKVKAGYPDLFLFKNRSGQFAFQTYHESGTPMIGESVFMIYGKPHKDSEPGPLPGAGRVGMICGLPVVAVNVDFRTKPATLKADLNRSFKMLMESTRSFSF